MTDILYLWLLTVDTGMDEPVTKMYLTADPDITNKAVAADFQKRWAGKVYNASAPKQWKLKAPRAAFDIPPSVLDKAENRGAVLNYIWHKIDHTHPELIRQ